LKVQLFAQLARNLHTLLPENSGCKRSTVSSTGGSRLLPNVIAYLQNYTTSHKSYIRICNIRGNFITLHHLQDRATVICFILFITQTWRLKKACWRNFLRFRQGCGS